MNARALALPILLLAAYAAFWAAHWQRARMIDFQSFYAAAAAADAGVDFYDVKALNQVARSKGLHDYTFPYVYAPFLAVLARPWGGLAPSAAKLSLLLFNLALLFPLQILVAADSRARLAGLAGEAGAGAVAILAVAALFALNVNDNIDMGQVNIPVLLLIVLCLHFSHAGRDVVGGAFLAAAVLIKVSPLLLLCWFLARGRWRLAVSCLASMAVLAAATLPAGGLEPWRRFAALLRTTSYGSKISGLFPPSFLPNISLAGFFSRLLAPETAMVRVATTAAVALLVGALAWTVARRRDERTAELMLLPFLVAMVVASPVAYLHHVIYLLPGLALSLDWAWTALAGWRRPAAVVFLLLAAAAAGAPFPEMYMHRGISPIGQGLPLGIELLTSLNLYALLALALAGAWLALHPPAGQPGPPAGPSDAARPPAAAVS